EEVAELVGCAGDMTLGTLTGHDTVALRLNSKDKAVLPRNLGIFGTVGSGKSNTCQVVIEEAARAGWAVVVIDVEGEYIAMDRPAQNPITVAALEKMNLSPAGIDNLAVFHPTGCPGDRPTSEAFTLRLADFTGAVISEVLEATLAERNAIYECIDHYH